jgi:hypothetical protein
MIKMRWLNSLTIVLKNYYNQFNLVNENEINFSLNKTLSNHISIIINGIYIVQS